MRRAHGLVLLLGLALVAPACTKEPPRAPVTGWAIGWTNASISYLPTAKILKTSDGGASWALQPLPAASVGAYGNDLSAVDDEVAWAALGAQDDLGGAILRTDDGGATWATQPLPAGLGNAHIKSIKGLSRAEAWAISLRGDVLHTVDGGARWTLVPVKDAAGAPLQVQEVNRLDVVGQDLWFVDHLGGNLGVFHSPDGGATWRQEYLADLGQGSGPLSFSAVNAEVAWAAVNLEGSLWGTTDGGLTWEKSLDFISGMYDFDDLCASSGDVVWIAQNSGRGGGMAARITVTGGHFQSNVFQDQDYSLEGISALGDDRTAWLVGQKPPLGDPALPDGVIHATRDGGLSWEAQPLPAEARDVLLWKVSFVGARR